MVNESQKASRPDKDALNALFKRISDEIAFRAPSSPIYFIVDFLCKNYPNHLGGFASIWHGNPELEHDRLLVVEFFKFNKLPTDVAAHFTAAGFDTLETLCSIAVESLEEIEKFNHASWLPGHKVRLNQVFADVANKVKLFRQEREKLIQLNRVMSGHCDHPTVITRTNVPGHIPATTGAKNPLPQIIMSPQQHIRHQIQPAPLLHADFRQ